MLLRKTILRSEVRAYVSTVSIIFFSITLLLGCSQSNPTPKSTTTPAAKIIPTIESTATIVSIATVKPNETEQANTCGIQECHGMVLTCGPNAVSFCTEMYALGDRCRQYFYCSVLGGTCKPDPSQKFQQCVQCVNQCKSRYGSDTVKMMQCESSC